MDAPDHLVVAIDALEQAIHSKQVELAQLELNLKHLRATAPEYASTPRSTEWLGMGILDAVALFLKQEDTPQHTSDIATALLDHGMRTRSHNFNATVYATLANASKTKTSRFSRTPAGMWKLNPKYVPSTLEIQRRKQREARRK